MQVVVARARRRCLAVLMFFAYLVLVVVHVVSIAVRDASSQACHLVRFIFVRRKPFPPELCVNG